MVEFAAGHHRATQGEDGLSLMARGGIRHPQFHPHPRLRPVIGWCHGSRQRGLDILEQLIARRQRPQQLRPPPDRQRRATHDLDHVDGHQGGRRDDAALLDRRRDVDLPLRNRHRLRVNAHFRPPRAGAPGDRPSQRGAARLDRRRKPHAHHPVGIGLHQLHGMGIVLEGLAQIAHLIVALAQHRLVADGVDPAALHGVEAILAFELEFLEGVLVVAVVEIAEGDVIAGAGDPHAALGQGTLVEAPPKTRQQEQPDPNRRAEPAPRETKRTRHDGLLQRTSGETLPFDLTPFPRRVPVNRHGAGPPKKTRAKVLPFGGR